MKTIIFFLFLIINSLDLFAQEQMKMDFYIADKTCNAKRVTKQISEEYFHLVQFKDHFFVGVSKRQQECLVSDFYHTDIKGIDDLSETLFISTSNLTPLYRSRKCHGSQLQLVDYYEDIEGFRLFKHMRVELSKGHVGFVEFETIKHSDLLFDFEDDGCKLIRFDLLSREQTTPIIIKAPKN